MDTTTSNARREILFVEVPFLKMNPDIPRYDVGEQYKPHTDYFRNPNMAGPRGNRIATVLVYLAEPEAGGETFFPTVDLEIKPKKVHLQF